MGVRAELRRQRNLRLSGTWRKRLCLWPKVVYDPDKEDKVVIWPFNTYWEQYIIGHYGYSGGWYASTRQYGSCGTKTGNL